ncbi:9225_t:CDS:2, partial [Cetraspora pellucida]
MSHHSQTKKYESLDIIIPVEEEELNNTRFYTHNIYEHLYNGRIGAPVREKLLNGAKVAADYPNSEFYGVDFAIPDYFVSPYFGDKANVTFIECDIYKKLPFPDNEFDYVFSKDKCLYMERSKFQQVLLELFRVLKPGGWLETGKAEHILCRAIDTQIKGGYAFGEFITEVILFIYRSSRDYLAPFMNISLEEYDSLLNNAESEFIAEDNKTTLKNKQ